MADETSTHGQLAVRIVTPDRVLVDTTADAIELPAISGYMEALYGAAPLLAELGAGEVKLHGGNSGDAKFFVAWGFVEVLPERVTVLAETALKPTEIDPAQAQQQLDAANKDWTEAGDDAEKYDYARAEIRVAEEKLAASKDR
ncbi:ATP synthase, F1 epsilon subunit [Terriglobus roseus DSM 18391]|uniref:ATP synthase epsilon chain n=1 Tax=Terriglobus roseus (strain DSM 18391 / NRRL B-41598 / KBS 63) TaxID=926566 RepID=I3ZLE0_TERRK|nr:ATP synthase F1 subunit epsilon [Terriglobus roseus]AFL90058.1 ATP synthase, F1 epsilon subunit [Terriglobus roseus DSM 18391]